LNAIEKSERIISGLLKHDSEHRCTHSFAEIIDEIFDHENKGSDTSLSQFVSDSIAHQQRDEIDV